MSADDLTLLRWAMEPAIDPQGQRLAYVTSGPDAEHDRLDYRVRIVDVATGTTTIIGGARRTRRPAWSPCGSWLAVLADIDGHWQLGLVDDRSLTTPVALPGDVRSFDWSPDGSRLACEIQRTGARDGHEVWLADLDSGHVRLLAPPGFGDVSAPAWSPDGDGIAVIARRGSDDAEGTAVWMVDAAGRAEPRPLASGRGALRATAWSADGRSLAYVGEKSHAAPWANHELWVVDRDGRERQLGGLLDRSIGQVVRGDDERGLGPANLAWSADSGYVLATFADGGTSLVAAFDMDGGWEPAVECGRRAVLEFAAAPAGAIAFTWSDRVTPGEVALRTADGSERACSDLARTVRDEIALAPTERLTCLADDGEVVEGWITVPAGGPQAVPLVVQVHGGPHYPVGERFSFDAQRLAGAGFAVLRANPRGSRGYGVAFAAAIAGDWGGRDVRDLMALIDSALASEPVDSQRVAVVGESYGGFVALWSAAQSDRFVAAVSENGIGDLAAAFHHNPRFWAAESATNPHDDPAWFRDRCPVTRAADIDTPVLLVCAADDDVSPTSQTEAMAAALRSHGRHADVHTVPDEGHMVNVFGRPSRRITKTRVLDAFLATHLHRSGPERRDRVQAAPPAGALT